MENKIRAYETVVIISASYEDEVLNAIQKKYEEFLKTNNVENVIVEKWGRKRMAYQIQKVRTGYYLILRYNADVNFVRKFERALEIDEQILRYLSVRLDKSALEYIETARIAAEPTIDEDIEEFVDIALNIDDKEISNNN
ncbi:MAG: 30S ribosomal protein S6 [Bacteroidetes bacterium]|nr:30S ribosomal protein S6 [Bacteroidota bacterium]